MVYFRVVTISKVYPTFQTEGGGQWTEEDDFGYKKKEVDVYTELIRNNIQVSFENSQNIELFHEHFYYSMAAAAVRFKI